jgi:hypothetical protein
LSVAVLIQFLLRFHCKKIALLYYRYCFALSSISQLFMFLLTHQSGKFRVETTITKSTKLHIVKKKNSVGNNHGPQWGGGRKGHDLIVMSEPLIIRLHRRVMWAGFREFLFPGKWLKMCIQICTFSCIYANKTLG